MASYEPMGLMQQDFMADQIAASPAACAIASTIQTPTAFGSDLAVLGSFFIAGPVFVPRGSVITGVVTFQAADFATGTGNTPNVIVNGTLVTNRRPNGNFSFICNSNAAINGSIETSGVLYANGGGQFKTGTDPFGSTFSFGDPTQLGTETYLSLSPNCAFLRSPLNPIDPTIYSVAATYSLTETPLASYVDPIWDVALGGYQLATSPAMTQSVQAFYNRCSWYLGGTNNNHAVFVIHVLAADAVRMGLTTFARVTARTSVQGSINIDSSGPTAYNSTVVYIEYQPIVLNMGANIVVGQNPFTAPSWTTAPGGAPAAGDYFICISFTPENNTNTQDNLWITTVSIEC